MPPALLAGVSAEEVPTERLWTEDPVGLRMQWRTVVAAVQSLNATLLEAGVAVPAAVD